MIKENLFPNFHPISPNSFFDKLKSEFGCSIEPSQAKYPDSKRYKISRLEGTINYNDSLVLKNNCKELQSHIIRRVCRSLNINTEKFGIENEKK